MYVSRTVSTLPRPMLSKRWRPNLIMILLALVANFTITNTNTFTVEVVAPDGTPTPIGSQASGTFFAFGTYVVRQSGAPGVYFRIIYPATRVLSTATGLLHGNFNISAVLQ